ncbi:hypothetical protein [Novosphingobium sp. 9]|uniref:hypothetical protein n=1 Tax=Novosphingobium sp. 9 TaxID=2025349 RepID=UPI0021B5CB48|nr:hypothetical protein [Novosphingobium sp. 9]
MAAPPADDPVAVAAARVLPGYDILASREMAPKGAPSFRLVAMGRKGEDSYRTRDEAAPARPLLIFEERGGHEARALVLVARNDDVVMRADEGGQCDPFLDSDATISVAGRYFTVENGVACGQHWTDFITFRLDVGAEGGAGFVFDNERIESWSMNPGQSPDAEALVRDGPQRVLRDKPGHARSFTAWRRR